MAGCQRGLSLSMLVTHDYNNIITCTWNIWNNAKKNNNKKRATACKCKNVNAGYSSSEKAKKQNE